MQTKENILKCLFVLHFAWVSSSYHDLNHRFLGFWTKYFENEALLKAKIWNFETSNDEKQIHFNTNLCKITYKQSF